ncbi:MAG: HIT domain-containing protein [bacterium]|nr:HIT domain-containing protein [bacterium]
MGTLRSSRLEYESNSLRSTDVSSNPAPLPGHLLIIPKRHIIMLAEMTLEERKELLELLVEFEEKILKYVSSGCDIRQHYKPYVPNSRTSVKHFHFHLQPRDLNDETHRIVDPNQRSLFQDLSPEEQEKLTLLLKD